jgi:hypothetical protein
MQTVSFLLAYGAVASAQAATILSAGNVAGTQVNEWRTPGTAKSADIDGDNVYGSFASVQWTVAGLNEHPAASPNPGWHYVSAGSQISIGGSAMLDRNSGGADVQSSIVLNEFTFELTGVPATYAGMIVRVGVMQDMLGSGEWAADQNKGLRLVQTVGGGGDSGIVAVRGGGAADGAPEMYFFDLTGVNPGDRFQIVGLNDVSGAGATQSGYVGPVSWDLVAVPEPGSAALAALGFTLLLRRGCRARRDG